MAFYKQNESQVWPRNGTAPCKDYYPLSLPVFDAQGIAPSESNPAGTAEAGGYRAKPTLIQVIGDNFGEWDGLRGQLMRVSQADTYNSARGAFPRAGTWEEPGGPIAASALVRLQPTTSAHPGAGIGVGGGPGPTMVFAPPPSFTIQTRPIFATGL